MTAERDNSLNAKGLCVIHDKYGLKAHKCRNVKCVLRGAGHAAANPDKGTGRPQGNAKGGGW